MTTSGRIHGEFLRLIFFLSNKQADDYFAALGYEAHKEEFCHRRGVFFYRNRCTIGLACAQAIALRGAPTTARRHVSAASAPRLRPPPHLAADHCNSLVQRKQGSVEMEKNSLVQRKQGSVEMEKPGSRCRQ
jgi:hypothetical protein